MTAQRVDKITPASEDEAAQVVTEARGKGRAFDIVGGGTRSGLGRPARSERALCSAKLSGIVDYEPAEMVISVKAGTPLREVEAALAAGGQMLPFEPMDHRAIYASQGEATIGGIVAGNISGPRRVSAGAARDALIGARFVNGRGEAIKSGGRVMKNVTGLDLVKLICGAHGAFGLITEATFKLLPRPEAQSTIVIRRLDDASAIEALTLALGSPFQVSGAAHLSAGMGRDFPRTFLRVEGDRDSVAYRVGALIDLLAPQGAKHALEDEDSTRLWRAIGDGEFLAAPAERAIWRVSLAPSKAPGFVASLGPRALAHFYDWGGGLVWLSAEPTPEASSAIRAALRPLGGHATLIRAPDELRERVDVFEPLDPVQARLAAGLKRAFDPDGMFNPGRMYQGV